LWFAGRPISASGPERFTETAYLSTELDLIRPHLATLLSGETPIPMEKQVRLEL